MVDLQTLERRKRKVKSCDICIRTDVTQKEEDAVAARINKLSLEEFQEVMTAMGIADRWESTFYCMECLEYYL